MSGEGYDELEMDIVSRTKALSSVTPGTSRYPRRGHTSTFWTPLASNAMLKATAAPLDPCPDATWVDHAQRLARIRLVLRKRTA